MACRSPVHIFSSKKCAWKRINVTAVFWKMACCTGHQSPPFVQGLLTSGYIILLSRVGERVAADMRKTLFSSLLRYIFASDREKDCMNTVKTMVTRQDAIIFRLMDHYQVHGWNTSAVQQALLTLSVLSQARCGFLWCQQNWAAGESFDCWHSGVQVIL